MKVYKNISLTLFTFFLVFLTVSFHNSFELKKSELAIRELQEYRKRCEFLVKNKEQWFEMTKRNYEMEYKKDWIIPPEKPIEENYIFRVKECFNELSDPNVSTIADGLSSSLKISLYSIMLPIGLISIVLFYWIKKSAETAGWSIDNTKKFDKFLYVLGSISFLYLMLTSLNLLADIGIFLFNYIKGLMR